MDSTILIAVLGVLVAWFLVAIALRHWGPGQIRRYLLCPEKKIRARVKLLQAEGPTFGSLKVVEVKECSLFAGGPITCEKQCMG